MRYRDVIWLAIRIFCVFVLVSELVGLPARIQSFVGYYKAIGATSGSPSTGVSLLIAALYFGPFLAYIALVLGLFWWSRRSSGARMRRTAETAPDEPDLEDVEAVMFAMLGAYFVADGAAELIQWAAGHALHLAVIGRGSFLWTWELFARAVAKVIFGAGFILRRHGVIALHRQLAIWIHRLRTWPEGGSLPVRGSAAPLEPD